MQGTTRRRWATAALLAALVMAACSGGDTADQAGTGEQVATDTAADGAGAAGDVGAAEPERGAEGGAGGAATEAADGDDDASVTVGGETAGRQVIRRATVRLSSDDPEATVDAIGRAAVDAGGFVAGTDLHREGGLLRGSVTLRVPADTLSDALTAIEAAGTEVLQRQLGSEDVTTEVSDVAAQLRNLRALETELLELLADARDTGDTEQVLAVFDRVRETRDEIERLEGRRQTLADLVALATITVHVEPTPELRALTAPERDPEPEPWSPSRQVQLAWQATATAFRAMANIAIVAVVTVLPVLAVWALPVALVILGWQRWRRPRSTPPVARRPGPPSRPDPSARVPSRHEPDGD